MCRIHDDLAQWCHLEFTYSSEKEKKNSSGVFSQLQTFLPDWHHSSQILTFCVEDVLSYMFIFVAICIHIFILCCVIFDKRKVAKNVCCLAEAIDFIFSLMTIKTRESFKTNFCKKNLRWWRVKVLVPAVFLIFLCSNLEALCSRMKLKTDCTSGWPMGSLNFSFLHVTKGQHHTENSFYERLARKKLHLRSKN